MLTNRVSAPWRWVGCFIQADTLHSFNSAIAMMPTRLERGAIALLVAMTTLLPLCRTSSAALPTAVAPSTGDPGGDWLKLVLGYMKDGIAILAAALAGAAFLWVAWTALAKFNEARRGRGDVEWGEVGLLVIVGGALLLFITFLVAESAGVFDA